MTSVENHLQVPSKRPRRRSGEHRGRPPAARRGQSAVGEDLKRGAGTKRRFMRIETAVVMNTVLGTYTVQQGLTMQGEKRFRAL